MKFARGPNFSVGLTCPFSGPTRAPCSFLPPGASPRTGRGCHFYGAAPATPRRSHYRKPLPPVVKPPSRLDGKRPSPGAPRRIRASRRTPGALRLTAVMSSVSPTAVKPHALTTPTDGRQSNHRRSFCQIACLMRSARCSPPAREIRRRGTTPALPGVSPPFGTSLACRGAIQRLLQRTSWRAQC